MRAVFYSGFTVDLQRGVWGHGQETCETRKFQAV